MIICCIGTEPEECRVDLNWWQKQSLLRKIILPLYIVNDSCRNYKRSQGSSNTFLFKMCCVYAYALIITEILYVSLKNGKKASFKAKELSIFCKVYINIENHISMLFLLFIFVWLIFIKMDINLKYFYESQFAKTFSCRNYLMANNIVKQKFETGCWQWHLIWHSTFS